ncbi:MAG: hypothetical protein AAF938_11410, partial [Myxococcota bacterium]
HIGVYGAPRQGDRGPVLIRPRECKEASAPNEPAPRAEAGEDAADSLKPSKDTVPEDGEAPEASSEHADELRPEQAKVEPGSVEAGQALSAEARLVAQATLGEAPPLASPRALRQAGIGCLVLLALSALGAFMLVSSALHTFHDPTDGLVPVPEPAPERAPEPIEPDPEPPPEPEPEPEPRRIEWVGSYEVARARASDDPRPLVIVFTSNFATDSQTLYEGVFAEDRVETELESFVALHVELDDAGSDDPAVEACGVRFLPHVCFIDAASGERLIEDLEMLVPPESIVERLRAARAAFESR